VASCVAAPDSGFCFIAHADRLPEEKSRGTTIDLGFAYLRLPGGETVGFVDVPGHERLVRTMMAGASGVDLAPLPIGQF
jgi:selenocysteine-specific elongation factor